MAQKVDMSKLSSAMLQAANEQEAGGSFSRVWDPKYGLMETPLNRKVIVYIPKNFAGMVHEPVIHPTHKSAKQFGNVRCINGLSTGFEALGYTGECPYCEALKTAWDLYSEKLNIQAANMGIDPQNDPNDALKGAKETLRNEMAIRGADKYIVFPVVLIPCDDNGNVDVSGTKPIEPKFVMWRKQRYEEVLANSEVLEDAETPAGLFMRWSFTYDTKGKQANARDSAKALKCKVLDKPEQLAVLNQFVDACEQAVAEFTVEKAVDNIKALNFFTYDDCVKDAEDIIKASKVQLSQLQMANAAGNGAAALTGATGAPALNTAENAVANFGVTPAAPVTAPAAPVAGGAFGG